MLVILFSIVILVAVPFFIIKGSIEPVKFSTIHPNIKITRSESILFNIYTNYELKIKTTDMWGVKPNIVGIIYTDKIRPHNQLLNENNEVDFGSLINITEQNESLIYIYVSKNIINSNDAKNRIKRYTVDTISYFQQKEGLNNDIFYKITTLPIDVKNN